jgi:hypothetical protein
LALGESLGHLVNFFWRSPEGRASPPGFSLIGLWQAKLLQHMKFNNFTTTT